MASKRKIVRNFLQHTACWGNVLLLFLYVVGTSNIGSLHTFFHEHEVADLHSEQNEVDPCHIALYHQDRPGGCEHDMHLEEVNTCSLCDVQFHSVQISENFVLVLPKTFFVQSTCDVFDFIHQQESFQFSGRAPPRS